MVSGPSLGTAVVGVEADTSKLGKSLDQGVTQAATNSSKALGGISGQMKAVGAAAGLYIGNMAIGALSKLGEFAADSIRAFSDLEQATGAVGSVFGENAEQIEDFAKAAAQNIGLSESAALQAASVIGASLKNFGFSTEEAATQSEKLLTLGADLSAMFGGTVPEAIGAVTAALRGETDPIERYGVSLNVAAIEAHALEEGLADTASEVTGQTKAIAALSLITEQTADTTGQFGRELDTVAGRAAVAAAELENAKARAGEALVPFKSLTQELQLLGASALGLFANELLELTGQISAAQAAIFDFTTHTGATADSLEALVTINQESGVSFADLAVDMELATSATVPLTDSQKNFLASIGLTKDEIIELDRVLAEEHAAAVTEMVLGLDEARTDADAMAASTRNLTVDVDHSSEAILANVEALQTQQDKIRAQTDPLFALFEATQNQAEAQAAVNEAINTGATEGATYDALLVDLYTSTMDVKDAQALARVATNLTKDAFVNAGVAAGIDRDQVNDLADALYEVEGIRLSPKTLNLTINLMRKAAGSMAGGPQEFADGGVVKGAYVGQAVPVIAHVGETVVPTHKPGVTMGANLTANVSVVVQGNAVPGIEVLIGDEVERRLERLAAQRATR